MVGRGVSWPGQGWRLPGVGWCWWAGVGSVVVGEGPEGKEGKEGQEGQVEGGEVFGPAAVAAAEVLGRVV